MVSLSKLPCFCGPNNPKRFTSKAERGNVKCATSECGLFCAEERYNELFQIYEDEVLAKYKPPNTFPSCHCGDLASLWISHSSQNNLRPYFRCAESDQQDRCEYFKWANGRGKKPIKSDSNKSLKRVATGEKRSRKSAKRTRKTLVSSDEDEIQEIEEK